MKPEIFMDEFERTHYGDSIFSSVGRALTISTRFENNCKMLAVILELKENSLFDDEEKFNSFVKKLYSKRLFEDIQKILKSTKDFETILDKARKSRNEIVHELTKGLDKTLDLLPKEEIKSLDSRLIELVENISYGDLITSFLLSVITKEPIPSFQILNKYKNNILEWVMDRTE